jgi:hypothetical protein
MMARERKEEIVTTEFAGPLAGFPTMRPLLGVKTGLSLMDDQRAFDLVANAIHLKDGLDRVMAGRALDQAVIFVDAAGKDPTLGLAPSPLVDTAWDRLILDTLIYTDLCQRLAGRYVHHTPVDGRPFPEGARVLSPYETSEHLRRAGYWLDEELWPADAASSSKANCTMCYSGDHDGGQGPRP